MSSNNEIAQKIVILNPDGSRKQLTTDSQGNINVNVAAGSLTSSIDTVQVQDGTNANQKLSIDSNGRIGVNALPSLPNGSNVIGTVVASAGTGLTNLAAETGGNLAAIKADVDKIPSKGQATMANSTPVVMASDQTLTVIASAGSGVILPSNLTSAGNLKVAVQEGMTNVPTLIASAGTAVTTTASYASIFGGPQAVTIPGTKILIDLFEMNVNNVLYQVKAGPATSMLHNLITDIALTKNADDYQEIATPFMYVDVLVKDAVGGTHGSVIGYLKRG